MTEEFVQIGNTPDTWFWALQSFGGKLYAGTYGTPKVYNYPPWTFLKDFAAGESIVDFSVFNNRLYASSEKKGYIYRMNSPTDWVVVHDDAWLYALELAVFNGYLYCGMTTPKDYDGHRYADHKMIRSSNGDSWNQCAYWEKKWIGPVAYGNYLYAVGTEYVHDQSYAERSSDGMNWARVDALCGLPVGWGNGPAIVFNGKLFLSSGNKLYKYNGSSLTKVFDAPDETLDTTSCVFNGKLYVLGGPEWGHGGDYHLYRSSTGEAGTWERVATFSANSWRAKGGMAEYNNELYLGVGNILYKMKPVSPDLEKLKAEIAVLNKRIADLEKKIKEKRERIAEIRNLLFQGV